MPVQIGAPVHGFSDPTGLLSDCHRRIEMFLGALGAVARVIDRPLSDETRRTLDTALRYFREAAPKHTADEEESLFPRLRQFKHPDLHAVFDSLESLESDHRWAVPLHAKVEMLGQRSLSKGNLSGPDVGEFRSAVECLTAMYHRHIEVEDSAIFPVAARLLSQDQQAAIGDEMATRRKVMSVAKVSTPPHVPKSF